MLRLCQYLIKNRKKYFEFYCQYFQYEINILATKGLQLFLMWMQHFWNDCILAHDQQYLTDTDVKTRHWKSIENVYLEKYIVFNRYGCFYWNIFPINIMLTQYLCSIHVNLNKYEFSIEINFKWIHFRNLINIFFLTGFSNYSYHSTHLFIHILKQKVRCFKVPKKRGNSDFLFWWKIAPAGNYYKRLCYILLSHTFLLCLCVLYSLVKVI